MGKDSGKTVCWHGTEVVIVNGQWVHKQSRTVCDDPHPFPTP